VHGAKDRQPRLVEALGFSDFDELSGAVSECDGVGYVFKCCFCAVKRLFGVFWTGSRSVAKRLDDWTG
jgi:hypothetical protein